MRGVVFDLDGTLIDSLPDVTNAANALLADEGLPSIPQSTVRGFIGLGERVFLDRLIAATDLDVGRYDALMGRFFTHYKNSTGATVIFPGVLDCLAALKADGYRLAICTNKPSGPLKSVLDALDLERWFDAVVAGDSLPIRKPDPAPLRLAFDQIGATEGVYVGDSDVDAATAQNAGVPFAFFTEGICTVPHDEIPKDRAFSDFAEVPEICRTLMRPL
jgi:phosphoglycolate phosphatase